jgi:hypothetical protein
MANIMQNIRQALIWLSFDILITTISIGVKGYGYFKKDNTFYGLLVFGGWGIRLVFLYDAYIPQASRLKI